MKKAIFFIGITLIVLAVVFGSGAKISQASSLTISQINAIISLLQAFGADSSVIANVQTALGGTQAPRGQSGEAFAIGDGVIVYEITNLRSSYGTGASIIRVMLVNSSGVILSGPISMNGYKWWKVDFGPGKIGWMVGNWMRKNNSQNTQPSITVLSPNGGEEWTRGASLPIRWGVNNNNDLEFDIKLKFQNCLSYVTACSPNQGEIIAQNVPGNLYDWIVGNVLPGGAEWNSGAVAMVGDYKIQICLAGSGICDISDSLFKIVLPATSP